MFGFGQKRTGMAVSVTRRIAMGVFGASAALFLFSGTSNAMVGFNSGVILSNERCEIVIVSPGTMTTNATGDVLSSQESGGSGGVALVTSYKFNSGPGLGPRYSVTFEAPGTFDTMPVGGDTGVTFEPRFSGVNISRGRNFNNRLGTNRIRLRRRGVSVTEITGDLIATRTGSTFPPGNYVATGTLRCE